MSTTDLWMNKITTAAAISHGSFFTSFILQHSSTGWVSRFPLFWTSSSSMAQSSFGKGSGDTVPSSLRISPPLLLYLSHWVWLVCGHSRPNSRLPPMWPSGPVFLYKCPYPCGVLYSYSQGVARGGTRGGFGKSLSHVTSHRSFLTRYRVYRWSRALGTLAVTTLLEWRVWHYPGDWPDGYGFYNSPCGALILCSVFLMDFLVYPVVYKYVEKFEGRQKQIKKRWNAWYNSHVVTTDEMNQRSGPSRSLAHARK